MEKIKLNNNRSIEIINGDKILFPKSNITKLDLVKYYKNISNYILRYIRNRPLTIQCFPQGINHEGFYRQHADNMPSWVKKVELKRKLGGTVKHILCEDEVSLIYLVNQNMISIHRWLSTIEHPEYPDIMVVDIDPPKGRFDLAVKASMLLKTLLEKKKYKPQIMLTGSKGIHVISKIVQRKSFNQVRGMLYELTSLLALKYPNEFSVDVRKKHRKNFAYLDISRNAYGQATIAPFSVRAQENAPIAMPLEWRELNDQFLLADKYNIRNVFQYLKNQKNISYII